MSLQKIRVMIVDDSIFFREFLSRAIVQDPGIEVVGLASDAFEAQSKVATLIPDVITLDMEMPKMRGTDFLRYILPRYPNIRVVIISSNPNNVFEALQNGAVDFAAKPNAQTKIDNVTFIREVISKIKVAAISGNQRRVAPPAPKTFAPANATSALASAQSALSKMPIKLNCRNPKSLIAIGASTGGTEAIIAVIRDLPANIPPILIVQHMPVGFTKMYAERLDKICKMKVKEAKNGDRVETGTCIIAAGDKHMRLCSDARGYFVSCDEGPKVSGHCPSVDALFESVANVAGRNALGVILTGMGADGANNMLKMRRAGAHTIGQDEASCVVYGMPMVAFNMGGVVEQLPLNAITSAIIRQLNK